MKNRSLLVGAALLAGVVATSCTPTRPQFSIQTPALKATLPNGIRLVVVPDSTTPLAQVDVRYEVGANEDPEGKAGLAHLVEHMMFQHRFGKKDVPIEKRQPTFQVLPMIATFFNATTIWDKTHYFLQAPKEDINTLIQIEALRLEAGCNLIPQEQFERERDVVRNEIRQRMGTADGQMIYETLRAAYPEGHPYHEMVGGNDEQLTNITMADVCKFMADYYVPSRAIVIVTGNVEQEKIGKIVSKYFSGIKNSTPAPRKVVTPITIQKHTVTKEFSLERDVVNVLWALPPHFTAEYDNAWYLKYAFGARAGEMADKYGVCDVNGVYELGGVLAPVMVASFEIRDGKSVDDCLEFVWKAAAQTHRVFESGNYKMEKIQKSLAKQRFVEGLESISARAEFVADNVQFETRVKFQGEDNYFYAALDRIDTLDAGKFKGFVKRTLDKEKALIFIAKASAKGKNGDKRAGLKFKAKTHEQKPDPVINPATANQVLPAPQSDSVLVDAERYSLSNGMKVVLLPYKGLPIVQANLVFNTGGIHEPASKAGLAAMAADLHIPGDSAAIQVSGVTLSGRGLMDRTHFSARGINIYLPEIINGLERKVKVGTISQKSIEAYRKDYKDRFSRPSFQRQWIYGLEKKAAIYGKDHPYVTNGPATPNTLDNFGRDDALAFGHLHYSAANGTLIIAGNFDPVKAKELIANSFGDWSSGRTDKPVSLVTQERTGPEYIGVVGKKGMAQMQIAILYPSTSGIDENYATRLVLAKMLTIRMAGVRTELGASYGVYARRSTRVGPSYYEIGGGVDGTRAGEVLAFMRKRIDELRAGVDFEQDFVTARYSVLKSLLAQSTESYTLAGRLTQIASYGLKADYYEKLARSVASMLPKQVKALMLVELAPNKEIVVNQADREVLNASFAEAGLNNVRIVDPLINE